MDSEDAEIERQNHTTRNVIASGAKQSVNVYIARKLIEIAASPSGRLAKTWVFGSFYSSNKLDFSESFIASP